MDSMKKLSKKESYFVMDPQLLQEYETTNLNEENRKKLNEKFKSRKSTKESQSSNGYKFVTSYETELNNTMLFLKTNTPRRLFVTRFED